MTESQVLAELFRLTGELIAVAPATAEDLAALRRRLAESLFPRSGVGVSLSVPADPAKRPILDLLQAIVDEVAGLPARRCRVLRRELPLRSTLQPASFPSRAGGQAVARTFGPMFERAERFVFFDLFEASDLKQIVFGGRLLLLLPEDAESEGGSMTFGAGSIWIRASLFIPNIRGFVGLRVANGTLEGPEPTGWTLSVVLDPAPLEAEPEGPGQDAGRAKATRPQHAVFKMKPTGMHVEAADGELSVYGATTTLTRTDEPPALWNQTGGVLIPFAASERELNPAEVHSTLLRPAGVWKIGRAGWLLPVSPPFLPPEDLGEAADAGAMALVVEDGLTLKWQGLEGEPYAARRATIAADSRELALVADGRTRRIARQQLALWRNSWIELHLTGDFRLHFVSSRSGAEAVVATVPATAHLDRPLQANDRRPRVHFEAANVSLFSAPSLGGEFVMLAASRPVDVREIVPLALSNALLKVNTADTLTLWGALGSGQQVTGAALRLTFVLHAILPFLPDPYAADFGAPNGALDTSAKARLTTAIVWAGPLSAALALSIAPTGDQVMDLADALLPEGRAPEPGDEDEHTLRQLVERTLKSRELQPPLQLLDLSSNADQFGIRTAFPRSPDWRPLLGIDRLHLAADARNLRVIAPPQVQWEPVRTHPGDLRPGFPQPLRSKHDGGPLVMGVADDAVHLVPIAPNPVLREMITVTESETSAAAIKFTLPFGIKAVAAIADDLLLPRPSVALNQPLFGPLTGGLQISVRAANPKGMPGGAIQTSNGTAGFSVLTALQLSSTRPFTRRTKSHLSLSRASTCPDTGRAHRASGSMRMPPRLKSRKWSSKPYLAAPASRLSKRRAFCGPAWPVWSAASRFGERATARFFAETAAGSPRLRGCISATTACAPSIRARFWGCSTCREIRETTQRIRLGSNVDLQAVYFDTDIAFANVVRGHGSEQQGPEGVRIGFVPARRQLGFVQLINPDTPQKSPLTPAQLSELLSKHGPVGGPIDCELDIGGSQQRMRLSSVYSAVAPVAAGGDPQFAVVVYGAPELPREGQWSVVRMRKHPLDSPEPEPARRGQP